MKWLKKHIKEDIIGFLFLCFLLGSIFIWFTGAFVSFTLSAGEKINDTVLWLTALVILWYAYETYQLKMSTSEQVGLQEDIMLNEFLPILEPTMKGNGPVIRAGSVSGLCVRNLGKGPAKHIAVRIGSINVPIDLSLASGEAVAVRLDAAARRGLRELISGGPDKLAVRIGYEDIYNRRFKTDNIYLDKAARGNSYRLRQGSWDFKRISNRPGHVRKP